MWVGARKLLRMDLVPARVWGGQAVGIAPTERVKLRKQMAAAAGRTVSVSLSLFLEVDDLEFEEEISAMATLFGAEGVWIGTWRRELRKAWRKQIFEGQKWNLVSVVCGTRDLGTQWSRWRWTWEWSARRM